MFFSTFRGGAPKNNERTISVPTKERGEKKGLLCTAPNAKRVFAEISASSLFSWDCLFSWLVAVVWWTLHKGTADADKIFSTLIPTTVRFMIFSPSCDPNNHTGT